MSRDERRGPPGNPRHLVRPGPRQPMAGALDRHEPVTRTTPASPRNRAATSTHAPLSPHLRTHFEDVPEADCQRVRRQLEECCDQNTERMVWIMDALRRLGGA